MKKTSFLKMFLVTVAIPGIATAQIQSNTISTSTVNIGTGGVGSAGTPLVVSQSGTVTTNSTDNISQIGGMSISLGVKTNANSLPVTLSTDGLGATSSNPLFVNGSAYQPAVATAGTTAPTTGTLLMGTDGTNSRVLKTATDGTITLPGIAGTIASGVTDSGNPVKIGCVYNSTIPTFTTGQRADCQADTRGGTFVVLKAANGVSSPSYTVPSDTASATVGIVTTSQETLYNGATFDRARSLTATDSGTGLGVNAVGVIPTSAASQGLAPATVSGVTSQVAKASPGNLYALNVDNATAGTYVIVYNATAAPTSGASLTTSLELWHAVLPGTSSNPATLDKLFTNPIYGNVGLTVLYSTSLTTYTTPSTAPTLSTAMFK